MAAKPLNHKNGSVGFTIPQNFSWNEVQSKLNLKGVDFSTLLKCVLAAKQAKCYLSDYSMLQSARNLSIFLFEICLHKNTFSIITILKTLETLQFYFAIPEGVALWGGWRS